MNQPGGNGGTAGTVMVTNSGSIAMGSNSAPITSGSRAWAIRAESDGGSGDPDANSGDNDPASGHGAAANTAKVVSNAKIDVHVDGNGATSGGAKGIFASAIGGNVASASYNFDSGGYGGGGTIDIDVNQGGDIDVTSAKALADGGGPPSMG